MLKALPPLLLTLDCLISYTGRCKIYKYVTLILLNHETDETPSNTWPSF